ncbi:MAG: hypothetical protein ACM3QS_18010 [Bacteroidota bacterium]
MDGKIALRLVAALVLIAAVAAVGFFAYNAGVAHGSPITIQSPSGQTGQAPYPYYGYPFHRPWGFGFGFLGCLVPLFLFFIIFGAFRFLLWGPRWGHMRHGYWGRGGWSESGVPPMFEEWHKRAHGEEPSQENKS